MEEGGQERGGVQSDGCMSLVHDVGVQELHSSIISKEEKYSLKYVNMGTIPQSNVTFNNQQKQAEAELCQAQSKLRLAHLFGKLVSFFDFYASQLD